MAENKSNQRNTSKELMAFIKKSPTAFHVVNNFSQMLEKSGFTKLNERDKWKLKTKSRNKQETKMHLKKAKQQKTQKTTENKNSYINY